jgi:amino acid adenylation domain-containing protein
MDFIQFLELCSSKLVRFSLENDQLKINAPRNTLTPDLVALLRQYKPELMQLLQQPQTAAESFQPIPQLARDADLVASFGQEQMWLSHKLDAVGDGYHFVRVLDLQGELDVAALSAGFSHIFARHEALRTVIEETDGVIFQRIMPHTPLSLPLIDLSSLPAAEQAAAAQARQQNLTAAPFDLTRDLMMRLELIRLDAHHHQLQVVLHHIASDGWSLGVLVKELQTLYGQLTRNQALQLWPLAVQYADYADWLRSQTAAQQAAMTYWQQQLDGVADLHALPLDFARPLVQSFKGQRVLRVLNPTQAQWLRQCAQQHGATLFMVLESLFVVLLARYGQNEDVLIGTTVANRPHDDLAPLIGYFVNMVALRHRVDGTLSFNQYLQQAKQDIVTALQHQHAPFEKVVQSVVRTRSTSYRPLLQIAFVLQNNDIPPLDLPGLSCTILQPEKAGVVFDLQLEVTETADGLQCCWEYASELFTPASMARMASHFENLLGSVMANPDLPLARLEMLGAQERRQQLLIWNDTAMPYPVERCLHEWFEQQVLRTPDAAALAFGQQLVSYAELNVQANRLAHFLISQRGVKPGVLVGICLARSPLMVVAMFAILKAGGAYVPLDPEYPVARLAFMIEDAALATVLTSVDLPGKLGLGSQQALCLDDADLVAQLQMQSGLNPVVAQPGVPSRNLAYLIFTSGSTGKPKGVMIEHRNVGAFLAWVNSVWQPDELACVLASTSICFDLSVFEIFAPLSCGGCVLIVKNILELHAAPHPLALSLVNTVPSAAEAILAGAGFPSSVQTIILAGEPLKQSVVDALYERGIARVYDLYGPTEDTIYSTRALRLAQGQANIGKPIANTQAFVLDQQQQLLPAGLAGELLLGGAGLARGYLKRDDLTLEKFIPNPFHDPNQSHSSERLYRTGDLVRWLPDGNLAYLGRIDHQVKIRGFRIELGEIESALRALPQVQDAVVMALAQASGFQQLVAYVVAQTPPEAEQTGQFIADLQAALASSLPDYMVPSMFVLLPKLPLTQNGKVDRKALPAPDANLSQGSYVAAENETQRILCDIWQEVLGVARIGIKDNFFQLGGHSLLATRLAARIGQEFKLSLPIHELFNAQTVELLAQKVDGSRMLSDLKINQNEVLLQNELELTL